MTKCCYGRCTGRDTPGCYDRESNYLVLSRAEFRRNRGQFTERDGVWWWGSIRIYIREESSCLKPT